MDSDPASGIGILAALGAGFVSFVSPCVLPLVPGYLSAVTGVSVGELERADWRRVLVPSLIFVASFSTIFILLGLTATGIGQTLQDHRDTLEKIAGALIVAMGAFFVASLFVTRLNREWHVDALNLSNSRCDPERRFAFQLGRARRPAARGLLGRAGDPLPRHGPGLLPHDVDLRGGQAPLHGDHGRRRRGAHRHGRADPHRRLLPSQHPGPEADERPRAEPMSRRISRPAVSRRPAPAPRPRLAPPPPRPPRSRHPPSRASTRSGSAPSPGWSRSRAAAP